VDGSADADTVLLVISSGRHRTAPGVRAHTREPPENPVEVTLIRHSAFQSDLGQRRTALQHQFSG
jgi:hypothetical protein